MQVNGYICNPCRLPLSFLIIKTNSMKWIKASELPSDKFPDIVVTMLDNGRVFAYDTTHSLKGLNEIVKHHPEMKCFCFNKAESPSESDAVEQDVQNEILPSITNSLMLHDAACDYSKGISTAYNGFEAGVIWLNNYLQSKYTITKTLK